MGKADLLDLPSKFNKNNYFVGKLRSGSGIEDDHIPFLHRGKCKELDNYSLQLHALDLQCLCTALRAKNT